MKKLAFLAAMLVAGCASLSQSSSDRRTLDEQAALVSKLERQCEEKTVREINLEIAQVAASGDTLTDLRIKTIRAEGDRQIAECSAEADRENEKITRSEISEYERQGQEQRQRNSLMATLTSSRIH